MEYNESSKQYYLKGIATSEESEVQNHRALHGAFSKPPRRRAWYGCPLVRGPNARRASRVGKPQLSVYYHHNLISRS